MFKNSIYTLSFISNEKYYLYNSYSNFFSEISEPLYTALNSNDYSQLPSDVFNELKEREIIVKNDSQYDFYYRELLNFNAMNNKRHTLSLVIAPTTACNFDCPYCFEPKKNTKTMTDEIITCLKKFVKDQEDIKSVRISWYGGEPLIAFPVIKKIYQVLSEDGMPKIESQSIITNGYAFNDEVIEFFKEHGCYHIQITIDGIGEKHNRTRCLKGSGAPTFNTIVANIDKILNALPNTQVHIRVNIDRNNYLDFVDVYKYFKSKYPDNKMLTVYPGIIRAETEDKLSLCKSCFTTSEILELHELLRKEGFDWNDFPKHSQRGCIMHYVAGFVIGPEGEIYKCWNDVGNSEKIVGYIDKSELTNASLYIKCLAQAIPFNDECKNCSVFPICSGGCAYHRYRNMFEGCHFDLCSPYKDVEQLKKALLEGTLAVQNNQNDIN